MSIVSKTTRKVKLSVPPTKETLFKQLLEEILTEDITFRMDICTCYMMVEYYTSNET